MLIKFHKEQLVKGKILLGGHPKSLVIKRSSGNLVVYVTSDIQSSSGNLVASGTGCYSSLSLHLPVTYLGAIQYSCYKDYQNKIYYIGCLLTCKQHTVKCIFMCVGEREIIHFEKDRKKNVNRKKMLLRELLLCSLIEVWSFGALQLGVVTFLVPCVFFMMRIIG